MSIQNSSKQPLTFEQRVSRYQKSTGMPLANAIRCSIKDEDDERRAAGVDIFGDRVKALRAQGMTHTSALEQAHREITKGPKPIADAEIQLRADVYERAGGGEITPEMARTWALSDAKKDRKDGKVLAEHPETIKMRMGLSDSFVARGETREAADALALTVVPMSMQSAGKAALERTRDPHNAGPAEGAAEMAARLEQEELAKLTESFMDRGMSPADAKGAAHRKLAERAVAADRAAAAKRRGLA
jgi:hypothetical protein